MRQPVPAARFRGSPKAAQVCRSPDAGTRNQTRHKTLVPSRHLHDGIAEGDETAVAVFRLEDGKAGEMAEGGKGEDITGEVEAGRLEPSEAAAAEGDARVKVPAECDATGGDRFRRQLHGAASLTSSLPIAPAITKSL